jgi:hypothetical protein
MEVWKLKPVDFGLLWLMASAAVGKNHFGQRPPDWETRAMPLLNHTLAFVLQ